MNRGPQFLCMLQIEMIRLFLVQILLKKESCYLIDQEQFPLTLGLHKVFKKCSFYKIQNPTTDFIFLILVM